MEAAVVPASGRLQSAIAIVLDPTALAAGAALAGALIAYFRIKNRVRRSDLERVERKLDTVIRHLGLEQELLPKASDRVHTHLAAGQMIHAIRAYREENPGVDLKTAKEAVEELERARKHPGPY